MSTRNGCRILPGSMYQGRTAVWERRGATTRPWEAKWSSGFAAVFGVYLVLQKCFQRYWISVCCCLFVVRIYMFGWLCRATCCSVVSTSMLGVSHAVQNEKKLWKFTQSDR